MAWELPASPTCRPNGPASTRCSALLRNSGIFETRLWRGRRAIPQGGIRGRCRRRLSPAVSLLAWHGPDSGLRRDGWPRLVFVVILSVITAEAAHAKTLR